MLPATGSRPAKLAKVSAFTLGCLLFAPSSHAAPILTPPADYSYMWFNYGVRDPRLVFSIQTNRYALSFDMNNMLLTHLHPLSAPLSSEAALVQPNEDLFGAETASLAIKVSVGDTNITLTGAGTRATRDNDPGETPLDDNVIPEVEHAHLVDSGRFFQRRLDRGSEVERGIDGDFEEERAGNQLVAGSGVVHSARRGGVIRGHLNKYDNNVLEVAKKLDIGKSSIYRYLKEMESNGI